MSGSFRIHGLLIDCSRVLEHPAYYFHLVDLLSQWGLNTLQLHFSDDHGLAIRLPGLEHLAMPHAMSAETVEDLIDHAAHKDVSIIPEIETFGHTRYITDHPDYEHLAAWSNPRRLRLNAIDPLSLDAFALLKRLLDATCELFPSQYVHIGCREVAIARLCRRDDVDPTETYVDHVNRMFGVVREHGRSPMFWADRAVSDPAVCEGLDKDAVAVHRDESPEADETALETLRAAGFAQVLAAPATAAAAWKFLPTDGALANIRRMSAHAKAYNLAGVMTTQWRPYRYVQRAMDYAIAYAAVATQQGGEVDREVFDARFAREAFEMDCDGPLAEFLAGWTSLAIPREFFETWVKNRSEPSEAARQQLCEVNDRGRSILAAAKDVHVQCNEDIWEAMVLAARCAWICSEAWVVHNGRASQARKDAYNAQLDACRKDFAANWDETRFPGDPARNKATFAGSSMDYALLALRRLPKA
jgi:hypothetical protein